QVTLPELTIDYGGFKDVPRYDRCTSCHLGIDRAIFDRASLYKLRPRQDVDKDLLGQARDMVKEAKALSGDTEDPDKLGKARAAGTLDQAQKSIREQFPDDPDLPKQMDKLARDYKDRLPWLEKQAADVRALAEASGEAKDLEGKLPAARAMLQKREASG